MTNAFSDFNKSITVFQSGLRWTGYCAELDITGFGIDRVSAYQNTEKMMNLWVANCIKNGNLEEEVVKLGFKKEPMNGK